jgi:soluble lytic murein transglycosylase
VTRRLVLFGVALVSLWGARPLGRMLYPVPYRSIVEQVAREERIDPRLVVAVMRIESGFDPEARSRVGARGLMQVMPPTALWIARRKGWRHFRLDRLTDPDVNIRLGAWYLSHLQGRFAGSLPFVLAAYNAGHAKVAAWQRSPSPLAEMYPETRLYVVRGIWAYGLYRWLYPELER